MAVDLAREELTERSTNFNDTTGVHGWTSELGRHGGDSHPDRCTCQGDDTTPHKHYGTWPHSCARCACSAYSPAVPRAQCTSTNGDDVCVLAPGHKGMHLGKYGTAWGSTPAGPLLADAGPSTNPLTERMVGRAYHGDTPFDVPYMSEILPGFWQGGCRNGLVLPSFIEHVVSLYPWEQYTVEHQLKSYTLHWWQDGDEVVDPGLLRAVAMWVGHCLEDGPTLVHCQAGLNRSSLLAAAVLVYAKGMEPSAAIYALREARSPACLCNPYFYEWLLTPAARELLWQ